MSQFLVLPCLQLLLYIGLSLVPILIIWRMEKQTCAREKTEVIDVIKSEDGNGSGQ